MIDRQKFLAALKAAEEARGVRLNEELAESLAYKVQANYQGGHSFGDALRLALNDSCIYDRDKRQHYSAAMGKYFGSNGGRKAAKLRAPTTRTPARADLQTPMRATRRASKPRPVEVVEQKNHQLAWRI